MRWPEIRPAPSWLVGFVLVIAAFVAAYYLWAPKPGTELDPLLVVPDGRYLEGDARWIAAAIALVTGVWATLRIVQGVHQISTAQFEGGDQKFNSGLGALMLGAAVAIFSVSLGALAGLAQWLEGVAQSDWIENNFEIQVAVVGSLLVIFADWVGRAWVEAGPHARVQREFQVNVYSMTFAGAVGVIVFVTIGSSAFAARLAQLQVEVAVRGDNGEVLRREPMGMERVQSAANRISEIDEELGRLVRSHELFRTRQIQQMAVIASHERALSDEYRRASAILFQLQRQYPDPNQPQRLIVSFGQPSVVQVQSLRERLVGHFRSTQPASDLPASIAESLDQADALIRRADALPQPEPMKEATRRAGQLETMIERLRNRHEALLEERDCVIASLARSMPQSVAKPDDADQSDAANQSEAAEDVVVEEESAPAYTYSYTDDALFRCPEQVSASTLDAERLIDAVLPLRRTWMSEQLAKRTPIALSIELVVVMGALGALLRLASARLRQAFVRPRDFSPDALATHTHSNETTLLTLGLQVVFGMATALALFILLNVTINAASMEMTGARQNADNLNPFTMAGLGLLGGFAALNVADWMGEMSRRILERGSEADEAPDQGQDGAPPPPPPPSPPVAGGGASG
jgi:hypothetical protein